MTLKLSAMQSNCAGQVQNPSWVHTAHIEPITTGNLSELRRLYESGVIDIHERDDEALMLAAANGQLDILRYLHQNGCDIHARADSPMRLAAANGRLEVVKYLHWNGCDIHSNNDAAIRAAAAKGNLQVVKYLHWNGCDLRACQTALARLPWESRNPDIVDYLAQHGIEPSAQKLMTLFKAIKSGKLREVQDAFRDIDLSLDDGEIIKVAAEMGHLDIVGCLHGKGCTLSTENETALVAAAANGHLEVVKYLHRNGCDIHANNEAAFRAAARNGQIYVVEYLHHNGCNIHAEGDDSIKAAAENGHLRVLVYLHVNGCDVSKVGKESLLAAEFNGHVSTYNYLTDCGLDGIAQERPVIEAMRRELFSADPIYHPSRIWEYLNALNMEQLRSGGIKYFKRRVNQNYFNFVPLSLNDPKLTSLFHQWLRNPRMTVIKSRILDPDINPETGEILGPDRRIFKMSPRLRSRIRRKFLLLLYRWLVSMLWDYGMAHDKMGLLSRLSEPRLGAPIEILLNNRLISQDLIHSALECNAIFDGMGQPAADRPLKIAEIGAGYGRLGYVLLHAIPCKYMVFDIPPSLYISQWYLSHLFPQKRVFTFRPFKRFEDIADELAQADIAFFTANQIALFPNNYFDLSINISSIHELKPEQIKNMLGQIYRVTRRHVYLKQYKEYVNPYDNLRIREESYVVPEGWQHKYYRTDPVDSRFFETLIEAKQTGEPTEAKRQASPPGLPAEIPGLQNQHDKSPTVSVLVANYNHAHYLPTSLAGICGQTRPAEEIIIVDDGSTDDSISVIKEFAAKYPNIRLLRNERNRGQLFSIQRALASATGEYVVWTSADDLLLPNFIERSLDVLQKFPEAVLCVSRLSVFIDGTNTVRHHTGVSHGPTFDYGKEPCYLPPAELIELLRKYYLWISGNSVVVKRSALLEINGFDARLKWHSDWFSFYVIALRYGVCTIPETLAMMRERLATYSRTGMSDPVRQRQVLSAMLAVIKLPKYRDLLPVFRSRPSLLSPFGRKMLSALDRNIRHFDLLAPYFIWCATGYIERRSALARKIMSAYARIRILLTGE